MKDLGLARDAVDEAVAVIVESTEDLSQMASQMAGGDR